MSWRGSECQSIIGIFSQESTHLKLAALAVFADELDLHLGFLSIREHPRSLLEDFTCNKSRLINAVYAMQQHLLWTYDHARPGNAIGYIG